MRLDDRDRIATVSAGQHGDFMTAYHESIGHLLAPLFPATKIYRWIEIGKEKQPHAKHPAPIIPLWPHRS